VPGVEQPGEVWRHRPVRGGPVAGHAQPGELRDVEPFDGFGLGKSGAYGKRPGALGQDQAVGHLPGHGQRLGAADACQDGRDWRWRPPGDGQRSWRLAWWTGPIADT